MKEHHEADETKPLGAMCSASVNARRMPSARCQQMSPLQAARRFLFAVCVVISLSSAAASSRPNVVLLLANDLGHQDIGCYGGLVKTPTLDALAGCAVHRQASHRRWCLQLDQRCRAALASRWLRHLTAVRAGCRPCLHPSSAALLASAIIALIPHSNLPRP